MRRSMRDQLVSALMHQKTQLYCERGISGMIPLPVFSLWAGTRSGGEPGMMLAMVWFAKVSKE